MGEFHIVATAIAGNGNGFPLMHTSALKGILLEVYPHAEGITWKVFHEKGYRSSDLLIFAEKYLSLITNIFLPTVFREDLLDWSFVIPGITKILEGSRPTIYLTIGDRAYVTMGKLRAPFEVAGDNTQHHYHDVFKQKPPCGLPRKPIRHREDCERDD